MTIPKEVKETIKALNDAGFEAYAVGGCVRDFILGREPYDWDITTNAKPEEIQKIFKNSVYENDFGTVAINTESENPKLKIIEITTYRLEEKYTDKRHPDSVKFTQKLEDDLARRDFTVNAIALQITKIIDPFDGQKDIKQKILKTPLDPNETFSEDPLRMLRAARFAAQLNFTIEEKTYAAIHDNRKRLKIISAERIQEEFLKLLATPKPSIGLWILYQTHVLDEFLPEISALSGVEEIYGQQHKDNLVHTFKVVDNIAEHSDNVLLRFAGLMHDIGKPETKKLVRGRGWTFDMHEHVGKKMAHIICRRLRVSRDATQYVAKLIRWHMQPINLMDEGVTDSAVRRLIVTLKDNLSDLLILCRSDITTGNPNKLQRRMKNYDYLEKRIVEVIEIDKLRAFQSPMRGEEIMEMTDLKPGPTIGKIKKAIEDAILDGVIKNDYDEAKVYFEKIKDDFLAIAQDWEKR